MANDFDPITLELIKNALDALVDEMALTLIRTAYSSNLKNSMNLSAAVCDAHIAVGAGGWGTPFERDAQAVLEDVLEEKVTLQHAHDVYGVVIHPQTLQVDAEATQQCQEGKQH